jgi:hypothetical protein
VLRGQFSVCYFFLVSFLSFVSIITESANYGQRIKSNLLPVFRSKLLREHSHIQLLACGLWLLLQYDCRGKELKWTQYLLSDTLDKKTLSTPETEYMFQWLNTLWKHMLLFYFEPLSSRSAVEFLEGLFW